MQRDRFNTPPGPKPPHERIDDTVNWKNVRGNLLNSAFAALLSGLLTYSYAAGQTAELAAQVKDTNAKIDTLTANFSEWKDVSKGRRVFMIDAGARVEWMCDKDQDCRGRFAPMHVPE